MLNNFSIITNNIDSRLETLDEREYFVSPAIILNQGIANGTFCDPAEFKSANWNGVQLVIDHPKTKNGTPLSANDVEIIKQHGVGKFFNSTVEDTKLKGEMWIDIKKIKVVAPSLFAKIEAKQNLEISTGFYSDIEKKSGTYENKQYDGIHRNIVPDHIAILSSGVGACGWDDGIGYPRIHEAKGGAMDKIKDLVNKLFNLVKEDGNVTNEEFVAKLIGNKLTTFEEADKDWLLKLEPCQLKKLDIKAPVINEGEDAAKDAAKAALQLLEDKKNTLIATLDSDESCKLSKEFLTTCKLEDLQTLVDAFTVNDFSGKGRTKSKKVEGVVQPSFFLAKKKKV